MKTKTLLLIIALGFIINVFGQKSLLELTFTAKNNGQYIPLDSILIENLTQGGDTTLYAPDTVLVIDYITNIYNNHNFEEKSLSVSQNYPNPFNGKTMVDLYLPRMENLSIIIRNILGQEMVQYKSTLNSGTHSFAFYSGNKEYYVLSAQTSSETKSIKMVNLNLGKQLHCKFEYNGQKGTSVNLKTINAINSFLFNLDDQLRYTGYAKTINSINGSNVIVDAPLSNENYEFEIREGIPCPGIPLVIYENQIYNTLLIGDQCWFKENLNVGSMIDGSQDPQDNSIIEKYCFNNEEDSCNNYGGLYQWNEMMQYKTNQGVQGICPDGWHIPTDDEWKILEGTVDSQFPVGNIEWDNGGWRGFDAGLNLKSTHDWEEEGNGTNKFGFTAYPNGMRYHNVPYFGYYKIRGHFWTSTEVNIDYSQTRMISCYHEQVCRYYTLKTNGRSVRCLKD